MGYPPEAMVKGDQKTFLFKRTSALLKYFFYSLNLSGVKKKVLSIESKKILSPVPSLKDKYSLSYDIFRTSHSEIVQKCKLKINKSETSLLANF